MNVDLSNTRDAAASSHARSQFALINWLTKLKCRFPLAFTGFLAIVDQAIFSGTSFLTAVLIGRATSPDQLGVYYLALSIVLVISTVQEQLIAGPYIVYSKRRSGRELEEYAGSMWAHYAIAILATLIVLLVVVLICSLAGLWKTQATLWVLICSSPMLLIRHWIRRFGLANLELKSTMAFDAAVSVLQLGGLFALCHFGQLSLFRIFLVLGGAAGLSFIGWFILARPRLQFVPARFVSDWLQNWKFGKWALQTYVLCNSTPQLMLWLVSATAGAAATGAFGACSNLIGIGYVILVGIENVLTPRAAHAFATGGVKDLRRILLTAGAFVGLTMGGLCIFILVTGDWLATLAFGPQFHGTGATLITLGLTALVTAWSILTGNGLWAIEQPRANLVADVCGMVVTLVAAALLIMPYGTLGAALATLAGATSAAVVRAFTLSRCLECYGSQSGGPINSALPS